MWTEYPYAFEHQPAPGLTWRAIIGADRTGEIRLLVQGAPSSSYTVVDINVHFVDDWPNALRYAQERAALLSKRFAIAAGSAE